VEDRYNRHRRWSLDGTWEKILARLRAGCDEAEGPGVDGQRRLDGGARAPARRRGTACAARRAGHGVAPSNDENLPARPGREAPGRSRGGLSTKIHLAADRRCRPVIRILTPGQASSPPWFYNTTGLNDCPPATWRSVDPRELARDFGVPAVHLNGPRFWTLDQIAARATGEVLSFGGLDARRVAELPIPPGLDLAAGPAGRYYRDITIRRETEWIFAAGLADCSHWRLPVSLGLAPC
jgi:hypothetical protein